MALRFVSFLGVVMILACAWALSGQRRRFPWRTVLWGLALQFVFALFILYTPFGVAIFAAARRAIDKLHVFAPTVVGTDRRAVRPFGAPSGRSGRFDDICRQFAFPARRSLAFPGPFLIESQRAR